VDVGVLPKALVPVLVAPNAPPPPKAPVAGAAAAPPPNAPNPAGFGAPNADVVAAPPKPPGRANCQRYTRANATRDLPPPPKAPVVPVFAVEPNIGLA